MVLKRFLFLLIFLLIPFLTVYSRDTQISGSDFELYRPAVDSFGYLGVNHPRLQKAGQFSLQLTQSLTWGPFFRVSINNQIVDIVDRVFTGYWSGSLGVTNSLSLGVDVPYHDYIKEADFNTLESFSTRSLGDVRATMKWKLVEEGDFMPGLSLLIVNYFPTGNENKFVGTSHMVPGADLIVGKDFDRLSISANMGARFPRQKDVLGLDFNDYITYGLGVKVPFEAIDRSLSFISEMRGSFKPTNIEILSSPVEVFMGLKKDFSSGLFVSAGGGGSWNNALASPRIRALGSVGFSPAGRRDDEKRIIQKYPEKYEEKYKDKKSDQESDSSPVTSQYFAEKFESSDGGSGELGHSPEFKEKRFNISEELARQLKTLVYFGFNQVQSMPECDSWIMDTARLMHSHPEIKIVSIAGYADSAGKPEVNKKVSLKRAVFVRDRLIQEGVSPDRLQISGYGEENPVYQGDSSFLQFLNRRVEMTVLDTL